MKKYSLLALLIVSRIFLKERNAYEKENRKGPAADASNISIDPIDLGPFGMP